LLSITRFADRDAVIRAPKALWNKRRLIGQKRPLKPKDVWSIRALQLQDRKRNLAL
jgi:hypothetical protein